VGSVSFADPMFVVDAIGDVLMAVRWEKSRQESRFYLEVEHSPDKMRAILGLMESPLSSLTVPISASHIPRRHQDEVLEANYVGNSGHVAT
jgi:hypothetical protein